MSRVRTPSPASQTSHERQPFMARFASRVHVCKAAIVWQSHTRGSRRINLLRKSMRRQTPSNPNSQTKRQTFMARFASRVHGCKAAIVWQSHTRGSRRINLLRKSMRRQTPSNPNSQTKRQTFMARFASRVHGCKAAIVWQSHTRGSLSAGLVHKSKTKFFERT